MEIYVKDLKKSFNGTPVIEGVSLRVSPGERIAVIGSNGAGKTTLFRLLNLTIAPDQGLLEFSGIKVNGLGKKDVSGIRRRIATIYQHNNLIPRFKVVHNVLSGRLGKWSTPKALFSLMVKPLEEEAVHNILDSVGIGDKVYLRTDQLSGGEQQRVAIARALIQDPDLVLADEPCSSLDPLNGERIIRLLVKLSERFHKTLITNLHCVDYAITYFPRVIGLKRGRVFFDLPSGKVNPDLLNELYLDEKPGEVKGKGGTELPLCCIPPVKI